MNQRLSQCHNFQEMLGDSRLLISQGGTSCTFTSPWTEKWAWHITKKPLDLCCFIVFRLHTFFLVTATSGNWHRGVVSPYLPVHPLVPWD